MKMIRQERRRLERKGIDRAELSRIIDYVVKQYSAVLALCLHDKLGFGKVRTQRFMGEVDQVFDSINRGYLSLDDVIETVEKELGIAIISRRDNSGTDMRNL